MVTRVYKAFLFKSKRLHTSLAASGPWVTMAAIRSKQARANLHRDRKPSVRRRGKHYQEAQCTAGLDLLPKTGKKETQMFFSFIFFKHNKTLKGI